MPTGPIYKVTIYMTHEQWDEMSRWSANLGKPAWEGLEHAEDQINECVKFDESFKPPMPLKKYVKDPDPCFMMRYDILHKRVPTVEDISRFDLKAMAFTHALIIGRRATGKSHLVRDIIASKGITDGIICSSILEPYEDIKVEKYDAFDQDIIQNFLTTQKTAIQSVKYGNETLYDVNKFVVFDDCLSGQDVKNPIVDHLVHNTRQYRLTLIHTQPYAMQTPCTYRTNVDCAFVFGDENASNRKKIYDMYGGVFPSFEVFNKYMTALTNKAHHCMVLYMCAKQSRIEDNVFWYVAKA